MTKEFLKSLGLNRLLSMLILLSLLVLGSVLGALSLRLLYREKSADVRALVYLSLEREIAGISRKIARHQAATAAP